MINRIPTVDVPITEIQRKIDISRFEATNIINQFKKEVNNLTGKEVSIDECVELLYTYVDKIGDLLGKSSVCTVGCNNCCKLTVELSPVEANYIENKIGIDFNKKAKELTTKRINKMHKSLLNLCPFNVDSKCSIYEARPLACRLFFTYDNPIYCEDPTATHIISTSVQYPAFVSFMEELNRLFNKQVKLPFKYAEIRDLFKQGDLK